jgi:inorganic pyrophosphatase
MPALKMAAPLQLSAWDEDSGAVRVIVESPKGTRSKIKFDAATGLFRVGATLPAGLHYPWSFGFVPGTLGGDGDPLDALVF